MAAFSRLAGYARGDGGKMERPDAMHSAIVRRALRKKSHDGKRGHGEGSYTFIPSRGKYRVQLTLPDGSRKQFWAGKTEAEAKRKLAKVLEQQRQGLELTGAADRLTVGAWLDQWLREVVDEQREPTTYLQYETAVRLHIKPFLGRTRLRQLTVGHIEGWLKRLREVCAGCNQELSAIEDGRPHTPTCRLSTRQVRGARTRQVALARLRTALADAQRRRMMPGDFNPARLAEMPRSESRTATRRAPTPQDVDRLVTALKGERIDPIVQILWGTGLRRAELLGLDWGDVQLVGAAPHLFVRRQHARLWGDKRGLATREHAKTEAATDRRVPLSSAVVQLFRVWWLRQQSEFQQAPDRWRGVPLAESPTGPVFTSNRGTRLEPRNLNRAFARICEDAGLSRTLHGLRHDFGSMLVEAGVPVPTIAAIPGHSSPTVTTRLYLHSNDPAAQAAVELAAHVLAGTVANPTTATARDEPAPSRNESGLVRPNTRPSAET
jgi:integrase